jgi:hypothetical protein
VQTLNSLSRKSQSYIALPLPVGLPVDGLWVIRPGPLGRTRTYTFDAFFLDESDLLAE